ncbi:MAG: rubredoxin [Alphaproteobacteria bacterium]|nr:rubredoxin [Alphaproteobacteria bacterium]
MSGKWECLSCGHIYHPELGAPEDGIPPGTPFADLPDGWTCPECGTHKEIFCAIKRQLSSGIRK